MQNSDYPINDVSRPVSLREMPYTLDIRALLSYAKANGKSVSALSENEKKQFLVPNPAYKKKHRLGIAAAL